MLSFRAVLWTASLLFLGLAGEARAWGPAVHTWIGEQALQFVVALGIPTIAELLRRHARSYLYGSLAPDFEVGKGSRFHEDHNHNWSAGRRILDAARTEEERAFALGYMSHLAADVIGHNHFVPNCLYRSFGSKKLGHAYWEMHADNLIEGRFSEAAAALAAADMPALDALLEAVARRGIIAFETRKRIFTGFVSIANHARARSLLDRVRPFSAMALRHEDVRDQVELSLACVLEMLEDPTVPLLGRYDPIGARNIALAKELRRATKRAHSFSKGDIPFPIPAELRALRRRLDALVVPA